ncbi:hypothetical protein [Sphingomonas parva]|uniref:hypothetical protein n=1 Tax=Sphingomonas parva TaxID=2555898 RepID=UPI001CDC2F83|nr:hypothetical protein [Sphingomonas parva]
MHLFGESLHLRFDGQAARGAFDPCFPEEIVMLTLFVLALRAATGRLSADSLGVPLV